MAPSQVAAQEDGSLIVDVNNIVTENISTISQDIEIYGEVQGDVTSWNGNITIAGSVTGDVISYTGNIIITNTAHIEGHIMSIDGAIEQANNAQIAGLTFNNSRDTGALSSVFHLFVPQSDLSITALDIFARILISIVFGIFTLAFCLLWIALWPQRTIASSFTLRQLPWRSLAVGSLTTLFLGLTLPPLITILSATIIGLPFTILLLFMVQIPYIYGIATLTQTLGHVNTKQQDISNSGIARSAIFVAASIACIIGIFTIITPIGGLILIYVLSSPGLGAVILSRGGHALPHPT
ncbi:MAG: polymer-forming cytoskeletal protein [Chloroflexota bacterium]